MKKQAYIIGSVSHGTMRVEDLIRRFLDTLRELSPKRYFQLKKKNPAIWEILDLIPDHGSDSYQE